VQATLSGKVYQTFEEFKQDMYLDCDNSSHYTDFIFTPDSSTPDLIYYQVSLIQIKYNWCLLLLCYGKCS